MPWICPNSPTSSATTTFGSSSITFTATAATRRTRSLFLSAAAQRTKRIRLITGAVLPIFNHPLKLAGEIGMLDAISKGRLEVGFARAFLPHEFTRFGVRLDDSRASFEEGLETVRRLLEEEDVAVNGKFHSFPTTTSLPRPTQRPRPPFWIAALATETSFVNAGRQGHSIMAIPVGGAEMSRLIMAYRNAWKEAGHPGAGRVMLAFHMFVHEEPGTAATIARGPLNRYISSLVEAASDWTGGTTSADYPGYDKIIAKLKGDSFESQVAEGSAFVGTPEEVIAQIRKFAARSGPVRGRLAASELQRSSARRRRGVDETVFANRRAGVRPKPLASFTGAFQDRSRRLRGRRFAVLCSACRTRRCAALRMPAAIGRRCRRSS